MEYTFLFIFYNFHTNQNPQKIINRDHYFTLEIIYPMVFFLLSFLIAKTSLLIALWHTYKYLIRINSNPKYHWNILIFISDSLQTNQKIN